MENELIGYLFVYFTVDREDSEQVYFSISPNGLHWKDLNSGNPVLTSGIGDYGVRDPFILHSVIDQKYYILATDLRIANGKGWTAAQHTGSKSIIVWESEDLIHWSSERAVEIGIPHAGCAWAPKAVFDSRENEYMVFWSSMVKEDDDIEAKHRIYCARTRDFIHFNKTQKYMERDNHVIDMTIIQYNEYYYRIFKDETTKNIRIDRGIDLLCGPFEMVKAPVLERIEGVEGPTLFSFHESNEWCLMVDRYVTGEGYLPLISNNLAEGKFRILDTPEFEFDLNKKRHGSILPLNRKEYDRLMGVLNSSNPVIKGFYADPDIIKVGNTYYIYPTTDGYKEWSGTQFHVFSSKDRKVWKDEGIILDVATNDVEWAIGSAWAPAIAHRKGKYYYYFCAKRKDGVSCIGVAESESPVGPFIAERKPLLTIEMVQQMGIKMCQTIDPSVFTDDDGTAYLLFGNGSPAIVALNDNMLSVDLQSMRALEGAYDFREAIMVTKKEGRYHFTWSCDDTRSENYHVNYGVSDNIYGPVDYKYSILEKVPEKNILATGHHSIVKDDLSGKYYIAYHRFGNFSLLSSDEKGCHRELCIDLLEFSSQGLMKPVKLT